MSRLPPGCVVHKLAAYDLRGFYDKFKDFIWTKDFVLERPSIKSVHAYDIFRGTERICRGAPGLASIPLPGIKTLEQEPDLLGVTYVPPKTIFV